MKYEDESKMITLTLESTFEELRLADNRKGTCNH